MDIECPMPYILFIVSCINVRGPALNRAAFALAHMFIATCRYVQVQNQLLLCNRSSWLSLAICKKFCSLHATVHWYMLICKHKSEIIDHY